MGTRDVSAGIAVRVSIDAVMATRVGMGAVRVGMDAGIVSRICVCEAGVVAADDMMAGDVYDDDNNEEDTCACDDGGDAEDSVEE